MYRAFVIALFLLCVHRAAHADDCDPARFDTH